MNERLALLSTSLLSLLLVAFHLSEDIVRGYESGGLGTLRAVLMLVVWLYGTLLLGVTAIFSLILSARGLWSTRRESLRGAGE